MSFSFVLLRPPALALELLMAVSLYLGFGGGEALLGAPWGPRLAWASRLSTWWILVPVHILEACWAVFVAMQRNYSFGVVLAWGLQTLIVGFPSLGTLLKQKNPLKKRTRSNKEY